MKKYYHLLLVATLFCGMGLLTSCTANEDNPTEEELFEKEMTAALADAQTYGPHTDAFAREVAEKFNGCVTPINYNGRPVSASVTRSVSLYFYLYFGLTVLATLICAAIGMDWHEAFVGCLASISNVGPALGSLGPAGNYAAVPILAKLVMCFLMLAGRLEVYTVMVLFCPSLWRK